MRRNRRNTPDSGDLGRSNERTDLLLVARDQESIIGELLLGMGCTRVIGYTLCWCSRSIPPPLNRETRNNAINIVFLHSLLKIHKLIELLNQI